MPLDLLFILLGIMIRQVDRWWFSDLRTGWFKFSAAGRAPSIHLLLAKQRERRNDVTPSLLMAGHWVEIVGYWMVCSRPGVVPALIATSALAVKCRHLQEVSHFGVHTALCKSRRLGDLLTEVVAQAPLALATVAERRESHVRRHHPNATVPGMDPNLAELMHAGLYPGCTTKQFALAIGYPCSLRGFAATCRAIWINIFTKMHAWWRLPLVAGLCTTSFLLGGPIGLLAFAAARLLVYPFLAWLSLLVEHCWFASALERGRPRDIESRRCIRVYSDRPLLQAIVRATWLPYGDMFHFAHSVYPTLRWNYLAAVERIIGFPDFTPARIFVGRSSVIGSLYASSRVMAGDQLADPLSRGRISKPIVAA
jgi:fatty acid desaturase